MHPELFHGLPSYGTLLLTAAFMGIFFFRRYVSKYNLDKEKYTDIALLVFLSAFVFSRVFQAFVEYDRYLTSFSGFLEIFKFWHGGFAFLGGLAGGLFVLVLMRKYILLPRLFDMAAVPLVFAHFIGRLGCLSAGCCWGKFTGVPWGVTYFKGSAAYEYYLSHYGNSSAFLAATHTLQAHPTQLYEASLNLGIALFLMLRTPFKRFHGEIVLWYMFLYGTGRFIIEIFRGDPVRGFLFKVSSPYLAEMLNFSKDNTVCCSTSQTFSFFMLIISGGILIYKKITPVSEKSK